MPARYKLVAVGDYTDKTVIIQNFLKDELPEDFIQPFINWGITDVEVNGKVVEVEIWDLFALDRYIIRPNHYKGTKAYLIFFSIYGRHTFEKIKTKWVPEIKKYGPENVPVVLVGTRCKKWMLANNQPIVTAEEMRVLALEMGAFDCVECCADNKHNLEKVFETAVAAAMLEDDIR